MKNHLYEIFEKWGTNVYVYSDTHFGDFESYQLRFLDEYNRLKEQKMKVIEKKDKELGLDNFFLVPVLDFNDWIHKLDEMQIRNINRVCGKNSTLILLGDVGDIECVKKLKAKRKILIMGNHDKGASNYKYFSAKEGEPCEYHIKGHYKVYDEMEPFEEIIVCNSLEEAKKRALSDLVRTSNSRSMAQDIDEVICLNRIKGFDEVYEGPLMVNDRVILSHEPIVGCGNYLYNIHGHVHNKEYKGDSHHLNCCAEAIDYTPVNLLSLFKKGLLKGVDSIHRVTIDNATSKKHKKKQ